MMKAKRIVVYTESAPVHRDVIAHGLHRASPPLLRAIYEHIDSIAIYPIGPWYDKHDFDRQLAPLCCSLPRFPTTICKVLRRWPGFDLGIAETLPARMLAPMIRKSSADILFAFAGADYRMLTRASRLAALAQKSHVFYVVDDFLEPLRITGVKANTVQKAQEEARLALRGAKHVFAITEGLCQHLRESYGISPTVLRLAFEPTLRQMLPAKKQIIYVGSISFLYAEGLRDLFKAVERVRHIDGVDLTVRLTVSPEMAAQELGELPPFVVPAPVKTSEALAQEIASSMFAFLPYSFDSREKVMVSTSFPSKSMEYFAYARSIVVHGPSYGVATQLFTEMGLPSVVSSQSKLEETVRSHLATWPDHSVIYQRYLSEAHSLSAARNTLCAGLGLEAS